jgi:LuxR family maltose regulon positive regulatory protein
VPRPAAQARLDQALERKLTLVTAPAGFGKTTLVSAWAAHTSWPVAWVSLDRSDNDPIRFWSAVTQALQQTIPALRGRTSAPPPLLRLLERLDGSARPVVLVLDDYHLIEAAAIHEALGYLLDQGPTALRVVLVTRTVPPFPLARLRANGHLSQLGVSDLQFSLADAQLFLNEVMGLGLPTAEVALLTGHTAGWIAGLQLVALALHGQSDRAAFLATFTGSQPHIRDYLAEEIFLQQPEAIQHFLLDTAVLRQLDGPLCTAMTAQPDSPALLEQVAQAQLFLAPGNLTATWYRYHPLFAEFLQDRLARTQPDREVVLHRRASAWYAQQARWADAIHHALAAGDFAQAADWINRQAAFVIQRGEVVTLLGWLQALPEDLVRARPGLSSWTAWMLLLVGQLDAVEPHLQAAERGFQRWIAAPHEAPAVVPLPVLLQHGLGQVAVIRAALARNQGDVAGIRAAVAQAAAYFQPGEPVAPRLHSHLLLNEGYADLMQGNFAPAGRVLTEARAVCRNGDQIYTEVAVVHALALVEMLQGRLHQADRLYQQAVQRAGGGDQQALPAAGIAYVGLGELHYEWDDLAAAETYLRQGMDLGMLTGSWNMVIGAYLVLARLRHAQGEDAAAGTLLDQAAALAQAGATRPGAALVAAGQARLALARGDEEPVTRWLHTYAPHRAAGDLAAILPRPHREPFEYLTLVRILLAQGQPAGALTLLARLRPEEPPTGHLANRVELLLLQAQAWVALGDEPAARHALAGALAQGVIGHYTRSFVDEGPALGGLIRDLIGAADLPAALALDPTYLTTVLLAFHRAYPQVISAPVPPLATPLPPLTAREQEVLGLLAAGLPYRAIAERLIVSENTARWHIKNLYRKLQVRERAHLSERVRELNRPAAPRLP